MSAGALEIADQADSPFEHVNATELYLLPDASATVAPTPGAASRSWLGSIVPFPVQANAVAREGELADADYLLPGVTYQLVKRGLDIIVAFVALVLLIPVMLLVSVAIRATSPGPVFFSQTRCGQDGRCFRLVKFRTMVTDAERIRRELAHLNEMSGPMFKVRLDPRITPVGRMLRKFSIDELPQLVNVLRGDMTLVGPRPSIVAEVDQFTDHQRQRLMVKPGLTCLWQVSGRSDLSFDEWVALDIDYIQRRSVRLDLMILLRTVPAVLSGRGAY